MCSRYYIELSPELRPIIIGARNTSLTVKMMTALGRPAPHEGEVKPDDIAAVIASNSRGQIAFFPMVWGFSQSDIENTKRSQLLINAKIETAYKKSTWKESFSRRRCVIPASYYFEWKRLKTSDGTVKPSAKYIVQPVGSVVTYMAGVYRMEEGFPRFAILTRESGEHYKEIHDRMPLIISGREINEWINPESTMERIREIARGSITGVVAEKAG